MTIIAIIIGAFGTLTEVLLKGLEDLEIKGQVWDHPYFYTIEIGQRRVQEIWGDLLSLKLLLKTICY